eukprot:11840532-Ditylum_brightwellii.AAC.1
MRRAILKPEHPTHAITRCVMDAKDQCAKGGKFVNVCGPMGNVMEEPAPICKLGVCSRGQGYSACRAFELLLEDEKKYSSRDGGDNAPKAAG